MENYKRNHVPSIHILLIFIYLGTEISQLSSSSYLIYVLHVGLRKSQPTTFLSIVFWLYAVRYYFLSLFYLFSFSLVSFPSFKACLGSFMRKMFMENVTANDFLENLEREKLRYYLEGSADHHDQWQIK